MCHTTAGRRVRSVEEFQVSGVDGVDDAKRFMLLNLRC